MKNRRITQEMLKDRVTYDCGTGIFRWRVSRGGKVVAGKTCGSKHHSGYIYMMVEGQIHAAHRLAWLYVHGVWPAEVDHKNRVRDDNRICNLRDATKQLNHANIEGTSVCGKGVRLRGRRFEARIRVRQKTMHLGRFCTQEEAANAYWSAAQKHFGEFARA